MAKTTSWKTKLATQASKAVVKDAGQKALAHLDDRAAAYQQGVLTVGVLALALGGSLQAYRTLRKLD